MGSRTFPLDIMYRSGTKGCFFPSSRGFVRRKQNLGERGRKKRSVASFPLACLRLKDCSDSVRHNRGIPVLFSSNRGKKDSSLASPPNMFKLCKFQEKDQIQRNFPKLSPSLLHLKTKTMEHLKYNISLTKYKGHSTFSSWAPLTKDYSLRLRYPSSDVQPHRKIHHR